MTPKDYLEKNPTHLIYERDGCNNALFPSSTTSKIKTALLAFPVDWTGYSEPHILAGPEFPWSKKRVVEWDLDRIYSWTEADESPRHPELVRVLSAENGDKFAQYGKYIDAPVHEAQMWLQKRTRDRMARGVEGTHQK